MTAEGILSIYEYEISDGRGGKYVVDSKNCLIAMRQYGKQLSKAFHLWASTAVVRAGQDEWTIGAGKETKRYTTEQLFQHFLIVVNPG